MPTICVFGDSTAWGAWDLEKGGWVNRLWLHYAQHDTDSELYNLSISGGTTETILARFESETTIRKADIVIFQTGGNDAAYDKDTRQPLVSLEQFEANLERIVEKARPLAKQLIFVGFDNCDESKTMPVSWCNLCYDNESIERYNNVMKQVCERHGFSYIHLFGLLENTDFEDGLHPNASGHQKMFEAVKKAL